MRLLLAAALVAGSLVLSPASAGSSGLAAPQHAVVVTGLPGSSVTTWPDFAPEVDRFAVKPQAADAGLSVTASSTDPGATVAVNGRPAVNGQAVEVKGLQAGDEVNVQITDAAGTSNQSWIVLPVGFPLLTASGPHADLEDGLVLLTLASFFGGKYTAVVDAYGVPVRAVAEDGSDFKQAASGPGYSIASPVTSGGYAVRRLDGQFRELRRYQLAGDLAASTDFHDSEMLSDGGVVLMGYDVASRAGATWTDAVIQVQDATGTPSLTWNSKDHVDEETEGLVERSRDDYAHINSLQRLDNGDVVASFRNLSQVMLIAGTTRGDLDKGEVIWRLGGLRNDFEFVDDPYGGPCAQHAATILDDGHLMIFDNGGRYDSTGFIKNQTADMCPSPGPDGPRVARPQSRITEYVLDTSTVPPTATLVWSHEPVGRYAPFAGNAQRLPNGNTFAGWSLSEDSSGATAPVATEVDATGDEIWSLAANGYFSYRAFKYAAPDEVAPAVSITWPTEGAVVTQGSALQPDFACSDAGGSNLDECGVADTLNESLTAQLGTHTLSVSATDRAGNATTRAVSYTVVPSAASPLPSTVVPTTPAPIPSSAPAADVEIKKRGGEWKGAIRLSSHAPGSLSAQVRVRNIGGRAGRLVLTGSRSNTWSGVRWFAGRRDVTEQLRAGTYRTARMVPGDAVRLRLVVRARSTDEPRARTLRLVAANRAGGGKDGVRARLVVR